MQIVRSQLEADNVISLKLRAAGPEDLPGWTPGAHIDLFLPSGLTRQYSLCGDPDDRRHYQIAILREPNGRGGSMEAHDRLRVGQSVAIAGPRNAFELRPAKQYLFVAGGIGITPILAMVRHAESAGFAWKLIYGGRTRPSLAFTDELLPLGEDKISIVPEDVKGRIDIAAVHRAAEHGDEVYACGPAGMLDALEARFTASGRRGQLHMERFSAKPPAPVAGDGVIRVFLSRKGVHVDVPPDMTVLAALRAAGHDLPSSCEQGICGTCETRVLDGVPDHRDSLLTEAERASNSCMMPCVSRAKSPTLTLDV
jgi:ferredoxin-NADP reductase